MKILILPGDGIGPEITRATVKVLAAANHRLNLGLETEEADIGLASLAAVGSTLPESVMEQAAAADGIVLGPVDTLAYPPSQAGGSAGFRKRFELFANMRPARTRPGVPSAVKNMDLVIARENTEGFYADRAMYQGSGEFMPTPDMGMVIRKITREGSRRIAEAACQLAMKRRRKLTIVSKRNVFKMSDGLFVDVCREVASNFDGLEVDEAIIDAMTAYLVRTPERFDVVVTTNMFGDILSDLAAELSGGLGLGPSINAGHDKCFAQAAHGAAPDIAGQNRANPTALIMSTAMMLDWLADRHSRPDLQEAANRIGEAVEAQLADPAGLTADLGGSLGTDAFGDAVARRIAG